MGVKLSCGWLPLVAVWAVVLFAGCSNGGAAPPEAQLHIERVARWYQSHRAAHDGKAPSSEKEFTIFIEDILRKSGRTVDIQELLTSPRDGQKYLIKYGLPASSNPERNVVAHEAEGHGGQKWLAFESAWSQEVDDAGFQKLIADHGK